MIKILPNALGSIQPPNLFIADTKTKLGRGVFAKRRFDINDVIEVSPVIVVDGPIGALPKELQCRVFDWPSSPKSVVHFGLALGYGSLYNHSDYPNLSYKTDLKNNTICFTTLRGIAPYEQLTINYNKANGENDPDEEHWFQKHKVEKQEL